MSVTTGASRCGMPSYTESSSIFGSIMISRTCSAEDLYRSDNTIALTAVDLPEPVVPPARQGGLRGVRPAARGAGRGGRAAPAGPPADVLAQHQRERRGELVVRFALDDLAQSHDLARLVRDLETHGRLAGDALQPAYADRGQRARQVLGQVRDLAHLYARRGPELEPGDHRARMDLDHLGFDAEVAQLELNQARPRLAGGGRKH